MNRVIWLKTARVYATDSDMTAKVERTTVKLEDGDNFNKFIKYIPLKGYKKDEQPIIDKVMEKKNGQWVEVDKQKWVDQLNEVLQLKPISDEKIDFKLLAERQANELKESKASFKALEERLKALESSKDQAKAPVFKNQEGETITGQDEVPTSLERSKEIVTANEEHKVKQTKTKKSK